MPLSISTHRSLDSRLEQVIFVVRAFDFSIRCYFQWRHLFLQQVVEYGPIYALGEEIPSSLQKVYPGTFRNFSHNMFSLKYNGIAICQKCSDCRSIAERIKLLS